MPPVNPNEYGEGFVGSVYSGTLPIGSQARRGAEDREKAQRERDDNFYGGQSAKTASGYSAGAGTSGTDGGGGAIFLALILIGPAFEIILLRNSFLSLLSYVMPAREYYKNWSPLAFSANMFSLPHILVWTLLTATWMALVLNRRGRWITFLMSGGFLLQQLYIGTYDNGHEILSTGDKSIIGAILVSLILYRTMIPYYRKRKTIARN